MATGDSTTMARGVAAVAVEGLNSDGRARLRALEVGMGGAAVLTAGEAATPRAAADMRRRMGVGPVAETRGGAEEEGTGGAAMDDCDEGEASVGERCLSTSILTLRRSETRTASTRRT